MTLDEDIASTESERPVKRESAGKTMEGVELLPATTSDQLVQLFKLLSDDTRLQILHILRQRHEVNVLTLCKLLGLRQPSVSHHLSLLRVHRLIGMRRDGKHNYYRIHPERIAELVDLFAAPLPGGSRGIQLGADWSYELLLNRRPETGEGRLAAAID